MNNKSESTIKKFKSELIFKGYSNNTIVIYCHYAEFFLSFFDKNIHRISQKETIDWLINFSYSSKSQQNQLISSIKLLYKLVVKCELNKFYIERPRKSKQLPKVIDKSFLIDCISKIKNKKHLAIISLGYSVGLRVSEVVNLKIEDVDSRRMIINIRNSKGNKDRLVPLSQSILIILREYYKEYKPFKYLFNGQNTLKYTPGSCNKIVKKYLGNKYHFHMLRHSSATSMLESGTDISIIQNILGHRKTDTTRIYAQVSTQLLKKAILPI